MSGGGTGSDSKGSPMSTKARGWLFGMQKQLG